MANAIQDIKDEQLFVLSLEALSELTEIQQRLRLDSHEQTIQRALALLSITSKAMSEQGAELHIKHPNGAIQKIELRNIFKPKLVG